MLIPLATSYFGFVGLMTAYGLTLGLSGPMAAWMSDLVPRDKLAPAMGLFRTVNDAGFVAGPVVLGSVAGATLDGGRLTFWPFLLAGVFLFSITLLMARARDPVGEGKRALTPGAAEPE